MKKYNLQSEITIIGGDLRIIKFAENIANYINVYTYGFDEYTFLNSKINKCENIDEAIEKSDIIVTAIPLSKDNEKINTLYSKKDIYIQELFENKKLTNKLIITGNVPEKYFTHNIENSNLIQNILNRDDFAIYNALATAEGTIASIINNTDITLQNSNIIILGFGRIGKVLANKLKQMNCNVYCTARKQSDIAWIETLGYHALKYEELNKEIISKSDIIINTIPIKILKEDDIKNIKDRCFAIDISSNPGGFDEKIFNKYNIKNIKYLGIPGKIAPITSAQIIIKVINNILQEVNKIV